MGSNPARMDRDEKSELIGGNAAIARGAVAAGCTYFAGYPITPSTEVMEEIAGQFRVTGCGTFLQMEDEIASVCSLIGASWAGARAMTATSGPGFSLMQEALGYAYFTETPLVVVNVMRAGPGTGQSTHVAQGDLMQFRYGSHGDVFPIVLCPSSVQECFDLTIDSFALTEKYRVPAFIAVDESIAHLHELADVTRTVAIPARRKEGDTPFDADLAGGVPPMPAFGDGANLLVTGSTHDGRGFRRVDDPQVHERLVTRLMNKTILHADDMDRTETVFLDDADIAIVACGISARTGRAAVHRLREIGIHAGLINLKTLWPMPEEKLRRLCADKKHVIAVELNLGQLTTVLSGVLLRRIHGVHQVNGLPISPVRVIEFVRRLP